MELNPYLQHDKQLVEAAKKSSNFTSLYISSNFTYLILKNYTMCYFEIENNVLQYQIITNYPYCRPVLLVICAQYSHATLERLF